MKSTKAVMKSPARLNDFWLTFFLSFDQLYLLIFKGFRTKCSRLNSKADLLQRKSSHGIQFNIKVSPWLCLSNLMPDSIAMWLINSNRWMNCETVARFVWATIKFNQSHDCQEGEKLWQFNDEIIETRWVYDSFKQSFFYGAWGRGNN